MLATRDRVWLAAMALGLLAITPADAWAYVDPGSGSYLFQVAAAALFAGVFTLRRCWNLVKARLGAQPTVADASHRTAHLHE
jgi:hypothetical protein